MPTPGTPVAVWTGDTGTPERIVWDGRRYRVTDTPTLLELDWAAVTHPPAVPPIWRFQGRAADGDTRVFDVRFYAARQEWRLLHIYG